MIRITPEQRRTIKEIEEWLVKGICEKTGITPEDFYDSPHDALREYFRKHPLKAPSQIGYYRFVPQEELVRRERIVDEELTRYAEEMKRYGQ